MDAKNLKDKPQPHGRRAFWTTSPRALPEQEEDSKFTVSVSPSPAAISIRFLEAIRKLEQYTDRQIIFLIMRENSLKNVTAFSPFMVEKICDHRANLPQRALIILDTPGGNPLGAFNLGRFFQQVCESHFVVIPKRCMSAGTLVALSADEIFLSPEGACGPVDMQMDGRSAQVILRSKDYVQDSLACIAKAIRAYDHDKRRPYAETADLIAHVMSAVNVPQLSREWGEAMEGQLSIKDYVVTLLEAKDYTKEAAEDIAFHLSFGYHDHGYTLNTDALRANGVKNVHVLDRETQALVDDLMATLPDFPIVGTLKHLDDEKPGEPPHHGPRQEHHLGEAADPASFSDEEAEA